MREQMPEDESSEAMRELREGETITIDIGKGHRMIIEAEVGDDGYGLVDHYEVRTRGSHVEDATVERDGLWVRRELARNVIR